jgi:hypothetical protein
MAEMLSGVAFDDSLESLRARLRAMTDKQLLSFGKAARFMCSPGANGTSPVRECFVVQLKAARMEWKRRHEGPLAQAK